MGRAKLQIKRIENKTNMQVTFSKRRNGLIKKAYELSVLCDVDIALIMISPSGKFSEFSGSKRIEDIILRYLNLPEAQRGGVKVNNERLIMNKLQRESEMAAQLSNPRDANKSYEELQEQISKCYQQLQMYQECLRYLKDGSVASTSACTSLIELQSCEKFFMDSLTRVADKKVHLQSQQGGLSNDVHDLGYNFVRSIDANYEVSYLNQVKHTPIFDSTCSKETEMFGTTSNEQIQPLSKNNFSQEDLMVQTLDPLMHLRNDEVFNPCTTQIDPQTGDDIWPEENLIDDIIPSMSNDTYHQDYPSNYIWQQTFDDVEFLSSPLFQTSLPSKQDLPADERNNSGSANG